MWIDVEQNKKEYGECHNCGNMKGKYRLWFRHLCQHFVCFCPQCYKEVILQLNSGEIGDYNKTFGITEREQEADDVKERD